MKCAAMKLAWLTCLLGMLAVPAWAQAQNSSQRIEKIVGQPLPMEPSAKFIPAPVYPGGQQTDGRSEAFRQCGKIGFDAERNNCLSIVGGGAYFDVAAVRVCGVFSFNGDIINCMGVIRDREYLPAEVSDCRQKEFSSDVVACFQNAGRPAFGTLPPYYPRPEVDSYILGSLRRIDAELKRGDVAQALADLAKLIAFIEQGMQP